METIRVLKSKEDASVNFIIDKEIEARFVRREQEYFIAYLSSQRGCDRACRFCHLTQLGKTSIVPVTQDEFKQQSSLVLNHYYQTSIGEMGHADRVNFNFMARGEPLNNIQVSLLTNHLFAKLATQAHLYGLEHQFNISTVMPDTLYKSHQFFHKKINFRHKLYYSMYSMNPDFRRRWLPKTLEVEQALYLLKKFQDVNESEIVFHHAFIAGENDSLEDVEKFLEAIRPYQFKARFNCVRYNPFSPNQGTESSEEIIKRNFDIISKELTSNESRIVPRVGLDVAAACGMFI